MKPGHHGETASCEAPAGESTPRETTSLEATTGRSTETAQQVVDEIVEIAVAAEIDIHAGSSSPAHAAGLIPVLTELLVTPPFLGVREHFVGLTDLLEPRLSLGVTRVDVRVILRAKLRKAFLMALASALRSTPSTWK